MEVQREGVGHEGPQATIASRHCREMHLPLPDTVEWGAVVAGLPQEANTGEEHPRGLEFRCDDGRRCWVELEIEDEGGLSLHVVVAAVPAAAEGSQNGGRNVVACPVQ